MRSDPLRRQCIGELQVPVEDRVAKVEVPVGDIDVRVAKMEGILKLGSAKVIGNVSRQTVPRFRINSSS